MDDLLQEFLAETAESLGLLDGELVRLEDTPNDSELLQNIFRVFHTIKGTCGFLNLPRLEKVAHAGEDLLSTFRENTELVTPEAVSLILRCVDAIRALVNGMEASGAEPETDHTALIAELKTMAAAGEAQSRAGAGTVGMAADAEANGADDPAATDVVPEPVPSAGTEETPTPPADSKPALAAKTGAGSDLAANRTIRVNVEVLESLITLVSELVLTRNQLLQLARNHGDGGASDSFQRLSRITTELHGIELPARHVVADAMNSDRYIALLATLSFWRKHPPIAADPSAKQLSKRASRAYTKADRRLAEAFLHPWTRTRASCLSTGVVSRRCPGSGGWHHPPASAAGSALRVSGPAGSSGRSWPR